MAVGEFAAKYLSALYDLGHVVEPSHGVAGQVPDWLPPALGELYRIAGMHPINRTHHRLLLPDELERRNGRVVFAEENQQVVVWAFDVEDQEDDPIVWQGQPEPAEPTGFVWYSEEQPLSAFVIEMWSWLTQ